MAKYRSNLPQLSSRLFLTDGGLETTLIYHDGMTLPEFAAFTLLDDEAGYERLRAYYHTYAALAREYGMGFILESATWRANPDWGKKLGYTAAALAKVNRKSIALLEEVRHEFETGQSPMVISGCIGPRGDGYNPGTRMSVGEAEDYHGAQVDIYRDTEADMVAAITMNYVEEAAGIARAARSAGMPVAISFTVETDGKLPTGQTLKEAIEAVDEATAATPAYYMINCAHPAHFEAELASGEPWVRRIRGIRANASMKSHAELNESTTLDDGDPEEFGRQCSALASRLDHMNVLGGCCGTDHRHVEAIGRAYMAQA